MKDDLIVLNKPKSAVSESIRSVRTNLQFSSVDEKVKTILVTSSSQSEGKSFISSNLATSFAQADQKTLIVDCDMRRGRQHTVFGVENSKGLSSLLLDDVEKNFKKYILPTEIDNLSVIPIGIIPPNPSELLASEKCHKLVGVLKKEYDVVIFDGVPVNGLPDSIIMAEFVDKVIIVSAYKQTKIEDLKDTARRLEKSKDKIAGVIVNKMPCKDNSYYYYY